MEENLDRCTKCYLSLVERGGRIVGWSIDWRAGALVVEVCSGVAPEEEADFDKMVAVEVDFGRTAVVYLVCHKAVDLRRLQDGCGLEEHLVSGLAAAAAGKRGFGQPIFRDRNSHQHWTAK